MRLYRAKIKKVLTTITLMALIMTNTWAFAGVNVAHAEAIGDFVYSLDSVNKTATITGFKGGQSSLRIPNTVEVLGETYKITSIGDSAFIGKLIYDLTIPSNIINIGKFAFSNCSIDNLSLGQNLKDIGNGAFSDNDLKRVTIPNSVKKIEDIAFANNKLLSSVIFEGLLTEPNPSYSSSFAKVYLARKQTESIL